VTNPGASQGAVDGDALDDLTWLDEASQELEEFEVEEFDIVSAPNDWNVTTIVNFIQSGAVKIPPYQRNYVWDIRRASKLIESLLLGLPVPQVFLYEEARNSFLVIDGQQRLLSLFFFCRERFPRPDSRGAIRALLNEGNGLSEEALLDDTLFEDFRLRLPKTPMGSINKFQGLSYRRLGDWKTTLDLRTIRNVVVKQTRPSGHDAIFEIFSRLNTGGVNLAQQEVRASLYHSHLMAALIDVNRMHEWRQILGVEQPDIHMRDSEVVLRSMALARNLDSYAGSMTGFVNRFCLEAQKFSREQAEGAVTDFMQFIKAIHSAMPPLVFHRQGKFSGVLFESFFAAWIADGKPSMFFDAERVAEVKNSPAFAETLQEGSTKSVNVRKRVELARGSMLTGVQAQ